MQECPFSSTFFDENVIFTVEENVGVPVLLYTFAQNHQRTAINRSGFRPTMKNKAELACGQRSKSMRCRPPADGLEGSGGAPPGALPYRMICGRKSGEAWLTLPLVSKEGWRQPPHCFSFDKEAPRAKLEGLSACDGMEGQLKAAPPLQ